MRWDADNAEVLMILQALGQSGEWRRYWKLCPQPVALFRPESFERPFHGTARTRIEPARSSAYIENGCIENQNLVEVAGPRLHGSVVGVDGVPAAALNLPAVRQLGPPARAPLPRECAACELSPLHVERLYKDLIAGASRRRPSRTCTRSCT